MAQYFHSIYSAEGSISITTKNQPENPTYILDTINTVNIDALQQNLNCLDTWY